MIYQEELPLVELSSMNDTHLEDILIINNVSKAIEAKDSQKVSTLMRELVEHTEVHFSGEETMMLEKSFPPYLMHKSEHDRALNELRFQETLWNDKNDYVKLKEYLDVTLKDWIINHIQTMDTVTAKFLVSGVSPCGSGVC
mgnify:CR=1 FL=1